jgi:hypothetical protein
LYASAVAFGRCQTANVVKAPEDTTTNAQRSIRKDSIPDRNNPNTLMQVTDNQMTVVAANFAVYSLIGTSTLRRLISDDA